MLVSGFSFIHNMRNGGYPLKEAIKAVLPYVDEMVVADLESDDGTPDLLINEFGNDIRIIDGDWGFEAGKTLAKAHALNIHCKGDIVCHFEADEVYDDYLIKQVRTAIDEGVTNISVERIQVEQNLQRVRWYPHWVHRIFPKGSVNKNGETTDKKNLPSMLYLSGEYGYLWDCTNVFHDSWLGRIKQQSELRNGEPLNTLMVAEHAALPNKLEDLGGQDYFNDPVWTRTSTPLAIPEILQPLVGKLRYE